MNIKIVNSAEPLTEKDIVDAEQRMGRSIPAAYRTFLLAHNGGHPKPNVFLIHGKNGRPDDESYLQFFLGISTKDFYNNLEEHFKMFRNRIPPSLLPIANDDLGNLICISTEGADTGKIYFWDHEFETEADETVAYDNVYFVANGFEEFLNSLHEDA